MTDEQIDEIAEAYTWHDADVERFDHRGFARAIKAETTNPDAGIGLHAGVESAARVIEVCHETNRAIVRFEGFPPEIGADVVFK